MSRTHRAAGAIALATALVAGLTACTQLAESSVSPSDCTPIAPTGGVSSAVATTGAFGGDADATFATPLRAASLDVAISGSGDGAPITQHGVFTASMRLFDATTGEALGGYAPLRTDRDGDVAPATLESVTATLPGLAAALECAQAGERVVAVMPATDLFGERGASGLDDPSATIVAVTDVQRVYASSASGVVLPPTDGMPAVVAAPSGRPGVTMPQQPAPSEQRSALRVRGFGDDIAAGDQLTLHVSVFSWTSKTELGSSWDPSNSVLQLVAEPEPSDDGLFGATSALIAQPVGSQVIVVVPPEQAGDFAGPVRINEGQGAIVLVIDVLAADPENAGA
ncbi:hypothetical protein GCM10011490_02810 [Pseudoclavibacter endophyticus]|uniref:Peptidylprolyl isomerase n=1 Tax=Pseudoclavibacter endophyticus TaxID=1778590 RepID=A0A6H9WPX7_9MICO|nr:hypothetical protein [Pseudoclavibacter endophyticus]KAB1650188.1 hypothetical protein F8O04_08315 [Pseudoclavibacter endophyticus]GGA56376.1 hypothetical protein GCM10011490_02810 [Pseudoclavibacter endophyticus]